MPKTAYQSNLGQGTTNLVSVLANIQGLAVQYGDASNTTGSNVSASQNAWWGWGQGTAQRMVPIWSYAVAPLVPVKATILRAVFHVRLIDTNLIHPSATIPSGGFNLSMYGLRRAATSSATWAIYATSFPWAGSGFGPVAASDYVTPALDTVVMDATRYAAMGATGSTMPSGELTWTVTSEVQYAIDNNVPLRLIMPVLQFPATTPTVGDATKNFELRFDNPGHASYINGQHTYLEILYRPSIGIFNALTSAGRDIDLNSLHDPTTVNTSEHEYAGTPEQGSTDSWRKYFVRSCRAGGSRRRVVYGLAMSDATKPDNSGSVSGKTLRGLETYDNNGTASVAATEGTTSGSLRIITDPSDVTKFKVFFTPLSTGSEVGPLTELSTGNTSVTFAADHIMTHASLSHVRFRSANWSGTTANVSDVWRVKVRADLRPNAVDATAKNLFKLAPPTLADSNVPDTTYARVMTNAVAQQFWAAPVDRSISSVTHTHLLMTDTSKFTANQYITVADKNSGNKIQVLIETVYAYNDGSYPNEIRLTSQITLGNYDGQSYACGGLVEGTLTAPNESYTSGAITASVSAIPLTAALSPTPTQITIIDTSNDNNETFSVVSVSGLTVNISGATTLAYTAGSIVIGNEPTPQSYVPIYILGDISAYPNQTLGQYLAYTRAYELQIV